MVKIFFLPVSFQFVTLGWGVKGGGAKAPVVLFGAQFPGRSCSPASSPGQLPVEKARSSVHMGLWGQDLLAQADILF